MITIALLRMISGAPYETDTYKADNHALYRKRKNQIGWNMIGRYDSKTNTCVFEQLPCNTLRFVIRRVINTKDKRIKILFLPSIKYSKLPNISIDDIETDNIFADYEID